MYHALVRIGLLVVIALGGVAIGRSQGVGAADDTKEEYATQYAQTYLQLAQTTLQAAEQSNEKVAGVVSPELVTRYQLNVKSAEERLELAKTGGDSFAIFVAGLPATSQQRADAFRRAAAARQRHPATYSAKEVEKLRLWAELARLNLHHAKTLNGAPRQEQLAWIASVLQEEILYLQDQTDRRPSRRHY